MIARFEHVSYRYPGAPSDALRNVALSLEPGSFNLLAGPSAGGKSTLLRLFNGLIPQFHGGRLSGSLLVGGRDPSRTPSREMARIAGMVFQEPEAQSVAETVEDEIAFGMEQQGVPPAEMRRRVNQLLATLGIERLGLRELATLSGGERQRVAIAAVLGLEPALLMLDEPTSQLDPAGAESVFAALEAIRARGDVAIMVAEHRLERLLPRVNGVFGVEGGIVNTYTPRQAAARLAGVPPVCELGRRLKLRPVPLTVAEFKTALGERRLFLTPEPDPPAPGDELLRLEGVSVSYGDLPALREASLSIREGEVVAIIGPNGSGKTTLFRAIAGLVKPDGGDVWLGGRPAPQRVVERTATAGLVPQDPAIVLYHETVRDELGETLRNRRSTLALDRALSRWNLQSLGERHPGDLSVGQQQRVAIGAMLAHEPRVWMLDEPTRGADLRGKEWLAHTLRQHAADGGAAILATHDLESAARFASRVIALDRGEITFDLPARKAFAASGPSPTQAARILDGAILPEEVSW